MGRANPLCKKRKSPPRRAGKRSGNWLANRSSGLVRLRLELWRTTFSRCAREDWWSQAVSNRRPLACHASALPAELWPQRLFGRLSLFFLVDVADDVGHVGVAFFLLLDEGISIESWIDFNVLAFHSSLRACCLGIGLFQRDELRLRSFRSDHFGDDDSSSGR